MPDITIAEKRAYLRNWAADNRGVFVEDGEVGIGRECVGILVGNQYPDYGNEYDRESFTSLGGGCPEANPWHIEGVDDAYHKHNCLAVLVRGAALDRVERAVEQLYIWVKHLEAESIVVKTGPRHTRTMPNPPDILDVVLHGLTRAYLAKRDE